MDSEPRQYLVAGFVGLAVALGGAGLYLHLEAPQAAPESPAVPAAGPAAALAPDFEHARLDGTRVRLSALRGKVVLVDFWATWCPPCRDEMPSLIELTKKLEASGVTLIAVAEDDPPNNVRLVREFARQVPGLEQYAVLGDPDTEARFGVENLPTLFVIDREGQLIDRFIGRIDVNELVPLVSSLASSKP